MKSSLAAQPHSECETRVSTTAELLLHQPWPRCRSRKSAPAHSQPPAARAEACAGLGPRRTACGRPSSSAAPGTRSRSSARACSGNRGGGRRRAARGGCNWRTPSGSPKASSSRPCRAKDSERLQERTFSYRFEEPSAAIGALSCGSGPGESLRTFLPPSRPRD